MPDYDFKQLSPHDFEQLSRDLIQERDQLILESFKTGRDGGIDFRYARGPHATIVQCKHYAETGLGGLMRDLGKEAAKVAKLKPTRYLVVTSVGLSPQNKTDIQALFGPCLATGDIIGRSDINNLLGKYPGVEQAHYKLWLASRAVLDRALHNASVTQSEFEVERVHRDIKRYVQSDAYPRARAMLRDDHVTIISGPPGVGKTTLAKMLLYTFVSEGYEAISILTDFQTGRERYQRGKKQIFYFDDFIGATFLGERASAFTRNEDRAILDFIELVKDSPTTRLVMTTREHILMQAIAASEKLKHSDLIGSRCVLELSDYSIGQRAQILYNHICFSDLPDDYRHALLAERFYHEIVKHRKFNPRLVEWLSSFRRVRRVPPERYQEFVGGLLDDPAEIWRHAYERQISDAARSVLLALYTYEGKCAPMLLQRAFDSVHALRARRYGFKTSPSDWRMALAELHGSFVRPGIQIEVIDPSVLDMLNAVIKLDPANALDMLEAGVNFSQARRIWNFARFEAEPLLKHLAQEPDRVATAFERLLAAPRTMPVGGRVALLDDSAELRIGTLIMVAEALGSLRLGEVARAGIDRLLATWPSDPPRVSDGVSLLHRISASELEFAPSTTTRIITALATAAAHGCPSDQLRELLGAVDASELDDEQEKLLRIAAARYQSEAFVSELRGCESDAEFASLQEDLDFIAECTKIDFGPQLDALMDARAELEDRYAARADEGYDDWNEEQLERADEDNAIDDLFDSLR